MCLWITAGVSDGPRASWWINRECPSSQAAPFKPCDPCGLHDPCGPWRLNENKTFCSSGDFLTLSPSSSTTLQLLPSNRAAVRPQFGSITSCNSQTFNWREKKIYNTEFVCFQHCNLRVLYSSVCGASSLRVTFSVCAPYIDPNHILLQVTLLFIWSVEFTVSLFSFLSRTVVWRFVLLPYSKKVAVRFPPAVTCGCSSCHVVTVVS